MKSNEPEFKFRWNNWVKYFVNNVFITGARFAIYQTKVGLMQILKSYRVDVCEKTTIPYVNHKSSFLLQPKDGIYLKFKKITWFAIFEIVYKEWMKPKKYNEKYFFILIKKQCKLSF